MALFKILRGNSEALKDLEMHDGWAEDFIADIIYTSNNSSIFEPDEIWVCMV